MSSQHDLNTIELGDIVGNRDDSTSHNTSGLPVSPLAGQQSAIPRWHPKVTVARLFVILSTLGLGTAKAVMSYEGDTVAPVTIEWITTIVIFLIVLYLSSREYKENATPAWLFRYDTVGLVWNLARRLSLPPPVYSSDERPVEMLMKPLHPPVTIYRLIVTMVVTGFGMLKAILSHMGQTTAPVTVEWLLGVVLTLGLYCLGLYEQSSTCVLPALFEEDYANEFLHSGGITFWFVMYIAGLAVSGAWTYFWATELYPVWPLGDGSQGQQLSSTMENLAVSVSTLWDRVVWVFAIGLGLWHTFLFLRLLVCLIFPLIMSLGSHVGSFAKRKLGIPTVLQVINRSNGKTSFTPSRDSR
ncbi:hypothetical protein BKA70DRAFT_1189447 [Coprinopsis sp. MPI-PUGE-AT-0042]|nr:hypothetical protein BKA70DRAFT_1189447 [Coprinopsis sp. MPI-PUGE-AT-0042]